MPTLPSPLSWLARHANRLLPVLLLHAALLWAISQGLGPTAPTLPKDTAVLAQLLPVQTASPPTPQKAPPAAPRKTSPRSDPAPQPRPAASPAPPPLAVADSLPSPWSVPAPSSTPPANSAPSATPSAVPAPHTTNTSTAAAPAMELPSSDARYLNNPKPPYPSMSKRLGEQGQVIVRVLVDADGSAKEVSLQRSSGFDRLDQSALKTVAQWRFVPGKRAGVAQAMWFNVPVNFQLEP